MEKKSVILIVCNAHLRFVSVHLAIVTVIVGRECKRSLLKRRGDTWLLMKKSIMFIVLCKHEQSTGWRRTLVWGNRGCEIKQRCLPPWILGASLLSRITDEVNPVKSFYPIWSSLIKVIAIIKVGNADRETNERSWWLRYRCKNWKMSVRFDLIVEKWHVTIALHLSP